MVNDKIKQRQLMKRLAVIQATMDAAHISLQARVKGIPAIVALALYHGAMGRTEQIRMTPAYLFRTDRPKLDARRVRRYRSRGYIVSINRRGES